MNVAFPVKTTTAPVTTRVTKAPRPPVVAKPQTILTAKKNLKGANKWLLTRDQKVACFRRRRMLRSQAKLQQCVLTVSLLSAGTNSERIRIQQNDLFLGVQQGLAVWQPSSFDFEAVPIVEQPWKYKLKSGAQFLWLQADGSVRLASKGEEHWNIFQFTDPQTEAEDDSDNPSIGSQDNGWLTGLGVMLDRKERRLQAKLRSIKKQQNDIPPILFKKEIFESLMGWKVACGESSLLFYLRRYGPSRGLYDGKEKQTSEARKYLFSLHTKPLWECKLQPETDIAPLPFSPESTAEASMRCSEKLATAKPLSGDLLAAMKALAQQESAELPQLQPSVLVFFQSR